MIWQRWLQTLRLCFCASAWGQDESLLQETKRRERRVLLPYSRNDLCTNTERRESPSVLPLLLLLASAGADGVSRQPPLPLVLTVAFVSMEPYLQLDELKVEPFGMHGFAQLPEHAPNACRRTRCQIWIAISWRQSSR